jgi:hypothetical protein
MMAYPGNIAVTLQAKQYVSPDGLPGIAKAIGPSFGIHNFTDEKGMISRMDLVDERAFKVSKRSGDQRRAYAPGRQHSQPGGLQLIHISPVMQPAKLDRSLERHWDNVQCKFTRLADELVRVMAVIDADAH